MQQLPVLSSVPPAPFGPPWSSLDELRLGQRQFGLVETPSASRARARQNSAAQLLDSRRPSCSLAADVSPQAQSCCCSPVPSGSALVRALLAM